MGLFVSVLKSYFLKISSGFWDYLLEPISYVWKKAFELSTYDDIEHNVLYESMVEFKDSSYEEERRKSELDLV